MGTAIEEGPRGLDETVSESIRACNQAVAGKLMKATDAVTDENGIVSTIPVTLGTTRKRSLWYVWDADAQVGDFHLEAKIAAQKVHTVFMFQPSGVMIRAIGPDGQSRTLSLKSLITTLDIRSDTQKELDLLKAAISDPADASNFKYLGSWVERAGRIVGIQRQPPGRA